MKRPLGWLLASALTSLGCSDARLIDNFSEGQTKIRVSPAAFIGAVPCARGAIGGLERYVVQLRDVTTSGSLDAGVEPTTSPPVPCDRAVSFPAVPLRRYGADILGFDRAIEPEDVGSVEPRWTARCGHGDPSLGADAGVDPFAPTLALRGLTVPLRGCTTFGGPASSAQLAVDVSSALGELRCGEQPGEVAWIEALLEGSRQLVRCGERVVFTIATPGRLHTVDLYGYAQLGDAGAPGGAEAGAPAAEPEAGAPDSGLADAATDAAPPLAALDAALDGGDGGQPEPSAPSGEPSWRTRCTGRSLGGVSRTATCEPFERILR